MSQIIRMYYNNESKLIYVENDNYAMDTSRINQMEMEDFLYPFQIKNIVCKGLYHEICNTFQCTDYFVVYYGSEETRNMLADYMRQFGIMVSDNVVSVTILCKTDEKIVITIDGKPFDTSRLRNRTIDEWIFPFSVRDVKWAGLKNELENYIGLSGYTIKFVGTTDAIKIFKDNMPPYFNVSYKELPASLGEKSDKSQENNIQVSKEITNKISRHENDDNDKNKESVKNLDNTISRDNVKGEDIGYNSNRTSNKLKMLIDGVKVDYINMKVNDNELLLISEIGCGLSALILLYAAIFTYNTLLIFLAPPIALIFIIIAFVKKYKKLALAGFAALVFLFILSYIILKIKWNVALSEFTDVLSDAFST